MTSSRATATKNTYRKKLKKKQKPSPEREPFTEQLTKITIFLQQYQETDRQIFVWVIDQE